MFGVAIIGAGPSGYFVAGEIFKHFPGALVFVYEKRDLPYGLVRYGVAPDHVLTKRAVKTFEHIASHPGFHYAGNIEVGRDISLEDLRAKHDAIVVCTGAEHPVLPGIPGVERRGVIAGLDFARWMNGEASALDAAIFEGVEDVVIIGNGNVALDCARMLARPDSFWEETEIAAHARAGLRQARIKNITIAGRRGPEHASFTEAELLEVISLPGWRVIVEEGLPLGLAVPPANGEKTLEFLFHHAPRELAGGERVEGVVFSGRTIPAQLVIFATGQRGDAMEGLPFDAGAGIIPNDRGRVAGVKGVYVCGWIKRGAKGLIGHNRKDAIETVARIVEDFTLPSP